MFKRLTFTVMLVLFLPLAAAQEASAETTLESEANLTFYAGDEELDAGGDLSGATHVVLTTSSGKEFTFDLEGSAAAVADMRVNVDSDDGEAPSLASIAARISAAQEAGQDVVTLEGEGGVVTYIAISGPAGPASAEGEGQAEAEIVVEPDDTEGDEAEAEGDAEAGAEVTVDEDGNKTVETPSGVTVTVPAEPGANEEDDAENGDTNGDNENGGNVDGDVDGEADGEAGAEITVDEEDGSKTVETPSGVTVTVPAEPGANDEDDGANGEDGENGEDNDDEPQDDDEDDNDDGAEAKANADVNVGAEGSVGLGGNDDED